MPTPTPKLGIPKPLGNETVSRAAFDTIWDTIDQNAAAQSQVDEPFYLKSATYDATNNQLVFTVGPGQASFLGTLVATTADTTVTVSAPAPSTTYWLYVRSDGTFVVNTTGGALSGAVPIWKVATGATVDQLTTADLRGRLPGAAAQLVQDNLTAHRTSSTLDHPDGSVTDAKIGNRTISDGSSPTADSAPLTTLLGWLANMIKAITGQPSWRTAPGITLQALVQHKSRHAAGGADPLTPADIGAVNKSGDTMSGPLTVPQITLPSGTPSAAAGTLSQQNNQLYIGNGTAAVPVGTSANPLTMPSSYFWF